MNNQHTVSGIDSVRDAGTKRGCDIDGSVYYTRLLVCHGDGQSTTLILTAKNQAALDFAPPQSTEAQLRKATIEELDSLTTAIRAERQSRHPEPTQDYICAYCGLRVASDEGVPAVNDDAEWARLAGLHKDGCEWCRTRAHRREPPPDDAGGHGVTVTEDDGEVPF